MKKLLCIIFIGISFSCFSQVAISVNYNSTPLKDVVTDIESKTNFLFSYSEDVIKKKVITLVNTNISEAQLISELIHQTNLNFEKVSDTQIIISTPSKKVDICGYLFDKETGETLPFASVLIKGSIVGTTSDENGFFQIEDIEPDALLIVQYVGYPNKIISATDFNVDDCKNIYLLAQPFSLNEIVLVGYLTKGFDKNTDGSLTLKNDELATLPGLLEPDVFQSLQMIPGITSVDESASDIQIRGGSADQNLVYFDGVKLYNTGHFFGMISAINPFIVKTTKVYKGGASPTYGDRISGVIDISSDTAVPQKTNGGIGVNGTHGDAFLKTAIGNKVGLIASARRSYTDIFQTPTFDALSEKVFQNTKIVTSNTGVQTTDDDDDFVENVGNEELFYYDASAKLLIQPTANDMIAISGLLINNDLDFSLTDDEDLTTDKLIVKNQGVSFAWEGRKFNNWHHSLKAYYTNFDSDYRNQILEGVEVEEENLRKNTIKDYGVDANLMYDFSNSHSIRIGYQYSNTDVSFQLFRDEAGDLDIEPDDDEDIILPNDTRDYNVVREETNQAHSVYGEYIFKPKNKSFISLGVRGSHYSRVNDYFIEPRLNAEYPITKSLRIKATLEKRYQPISQLIEFEDTQLRLENGVWSLSDNFEIPILESFQYSGGIFIIKNGWALDIDAYIKNISGLTSFTNGFTNVSEELSEGESDIIGLDVMLRKQINTYRIWLGYTYNDIEYSFPELQSNPFSGNNDITHNFRVSNTFELKKWEFSLGWMYRTGSPYTPAEGISSEEVVFGDINSQRLPDYHRLDASLLYKFFSAKSDFNGVVGVSVQNIYARQVPISVSYRVDVDPITGQEELNQVQQLSLGFTPNFSFRIYF